MVLEIVTQGWTPCHPFSSLERILGSKQIRQTQDNTGKCYEVGFVGTKMPGICRGCKNDEKRKCYPFSRSPVFSLSLCHIVEDRAWLAAWVACQGRPCVLQLGETQLKLDRTLKGAGSLVPTREQCKVDSQEPDATGFCSPVLQDFLQDSPLPHSPSTCPHGPAWTEPLQLSDHGRKGNGIQRLHQLAQSKPCSSSSSLPSYKLPKAEKETVF